MWLIFPISLILTVLCGMKNMKSILKLSGRMFHQNNEISSPVMSTQVEFLITQNASS